jgi:UDP-galactose transporter B1
MRNEVEAQEKHTTGSANVSSVVSESAPAKAAVAAVDTVAETPGLMQLLICVLGIYAALYVPCKGMVI